MRNTVVVDMTNGGALTAWDSVAESENTINLLVHTGAGANPKIYLENRTTSGTITGFDTDSIYFYQIPAAYIPEYEFGADNHLYVTLSDDTQTAETIRFLFNEDTGGQMTIQKDASGRQFFCSYQKIMTDAEVNEVIQQAQTTIEQLPQTITTTASSSTVANNVNSFNLDGIFESIMTNIKPVLLKKVNGNYVYVNTPPSNGIRNYISIKENYIQFIEVHLPSGTSFAEGDTTAFTLGGQQVYYTSIDGGSAYKNLTFTSPTVLNGSSVDVSLYAVRIPTPTATYIKSQYKWTYKSDIDSFVVDLIFGVGDANGNGIYKFSKDANSGSFVYTSRTTGQTIGFKLQDDGVYYTQNGTNWFLVGSGSTGGNVKIIDHAPVESDLTGETTVFARYDPQDTPILNGAIGVLFNALNVYVEQPVIAAVTISPSSASVTQGRTQQFTANVAVTWTVTGNTSSGTSIDANGLLTVGNDEEASKIFITARSTVDTSKYASAEVDVTETSKLYLFDNGVSEASGGWKLQGIYEEGYPPGTYVSYSIGTTLNITIQRNVSNCYLETENLIDLTGYTKICAICDVYIDADAPNTSYNRQQNLFYANANNQIVREVQHEEWGSPSRTINDMYLEMQLLGTTGGYHVGVGGAHGEVLDFKQVWLE